MRGISIVIEIGEVRPNETDAMLALMCRSFDLPFEAARELFYADPYFEIENKRVLRVDGQIVSCLTIVPRDAWIGRGLVPIGGIAGLTTHPDYRRRGYGGMLLTDTLRHLRERGFALAALFPVDAAYYRRFGFETVSTVCRYRTAPAHLPAYPEAAHVRSANIADIPQISRIYKYESNEKSLRCLRDRKRWEYLLHYARQVVVYCEADKPITGYAIYDLRVNSPKSQPILRVLEIASLTVETKRGLIGFLAAQSAIGSIEAEMEWEPLTASGLLGSLRRNKVEEALATLEIVPSMMARILDLPALLQSLRSNLWEFSTDMTLWMQDALFGTSAVRLQKSELGEPTMLTVSDAELTQRDSGIEGDVTAWTQTLVGFHSLDEACALGLLAASPEVRKAAKWFFPQRSPFLPAPDHF